MHNLLRLLRVGGVEAISQRRLQQHSLFRLSEPGNDNWGRLLLHILYFAEHQCGKDHKEESSVQSLGENLLL